LGGNNRGSSFDNGHHPNSRSKTRQGKHLNPQGIPENIPSGRLTSGGGSPIDKIDGNLYLDFSDSNGFSLEELASIQQIMNTKGKNGNIFDINNQKKLQCVLRNGYTYKFAEKKYFSKSHHQKYIPNSKDFKNDIRNNRTEKRGSLQPKNTDFDLLNSHKASTFSPKLCNESSVKGHESTSSLNSTAQIYNEMFSDRVNSIPNAPINEPVNNIPVQNVEIKLNTARTNRMYKDLNIDPGLREVFNGYNFKQLMEIKKLHLLYAHQKGKSTKQGI